MEAKLDNETSILTDKREISALSGSKLGREICSTGINSQPGHLNGWLSTNTFLKEPNQSTTVSGPKLKLTARVPPKFFAKFIKERSLKSDPPRLQSPNLCSHRGNAGETSLGNIVPFSTEVYSSTLEESSREFFEVSPPSLLPINTRFRNIKLSLKKQDSSSGSPRAFRQKPLLLKINSKVLEEYNPVKLTTNELIKSGCTNKLVEDRSERKSQNCKLSSTLGNIITQTNPMRCDQNAADAGSVEPTHTCKGEQLPVAKPSCNFIRKCSTFREPANSKHPEGVILNNPASLNNLGNSQGKPSGEKKDLPSDDLQKLDYKRLLNNNNHSVTSIGFDQFKQIQKACLDSSERKSILFSRGRTMDRSKTNESKSYNESSNSQKRVSFSKNLVMFVYKKD